MGCFTCIKVIMVIFNVLIFLGGGVLLGVGIWVTVDSSSFLKTFAGLSADTAAQLINVGYLLIALGCLLIILGFLGCCGAQKESKCLLIIFFTIILIIFIAEIVGAILVLVYSSQAQTWLAGLLIPVLQKEYGTNQDVTKLWNATMMDAKCCGLTGYSDFNNSTYVQQHSSQYPSFCCNNTSPCTAAVANTAKIPGCFQHILDLVKQNAPIVGGVAAGICALELAAMIVSMYLYCQIDKGGSVH
ncbi:tetraspanin-1-like [Pelobates fuscus]|uniref:tetraspanin-1-like n=1 Tax=Pelobates fuscus TaxID=191477 RepID=UPI002FE4E0D2